VAFSRDVAGNWRVSGRAAWERGRTIPYKTEKVDMRKRQNRCRISERGTKVKNNETSV
jgi:hypothetical protein